MPKVSVITTVYNGEKYIQQAVQSILDQSFVDFEYIIVNDGSTDGTMDCLQSVSDARVVVVDIRKSGRGAALNAGLEKCKAKYISILDADDIASINRLEIQFRILEHNPEISLLASNCVVDQKRQLPFSAEDVSLDLIHGCSFIKRNPICHSSVMIRADALRNVGGYDVNRKVLFDYDLWLRMSLADCVMVNIKLPLVFKRKHSGQNFERKRRCYYLWEATKLKLKAKRCFSDSAIDYFYILAAFAYGLLPAYLRKKMMGRF